MEVRCGGKLVPKGRRCVGVGIPGVTAEAVSSRPRPAAAGGAVPLRKRPTAVGSAVRLKSAVAACLSPRGAAASAFGPLGLSWKCFLLHLRPAMAGGAVPLRKRPTAVGSAVRLKSAVAACLSPRGAAASAFGPLGLSWKCFLLHLRPAMAGDAVPLRKRPTAVGSAVRLKSAVAACLSPRGAAASAFGPLGLSWKCFLLHLRPAMAGGAVPLRKRPTAVGSAVRLKSAVAACLSPRGAAASAFGPLGLSWKCFLLHLRPAMAGDAVPLRKRPTAVGSAVWWKSAVAACLFPRDAAASVLEFLGLPSRRFRRARDLLRQVALCHCARDLLRWVAPCG
ncbi:hypothetical protein Vafri_2021 [Volvox africanus]|nr:hypothetical protein Vafri_2021 [Volvox africanus]